MKTFNSLFAFLALFMIASGTAIPRSAAALTGDTDPAFDVKDTSDTADTTSSNLTPCQQCSKIKKDCTNNCSGQSNCSANCKSMACKTIVNGQTCSAMCLWYC